MQLLQTIIKLTVLYFQPQCCISYTVHLTFYGKYSTNFVFDCPTQSTIIFNLANHSLL